jgi:hypothetical protein
MGAAPADGEHLAGAEGDAVIRVIGVIMATYEPGGAITTGSFAVEQLAR